MCNSSCPLSQDELFEQCAVADNNALNKLCKLNAIFLEENTAQNANDLMIKMVKINQNYDITSTKFTPKQRELYNFCCDSPSCSYKEIFYFTGISPSVINNMVKKGILNAFESQSYRDPYAHIDKFYGDNSDTLNADQSAALNSLNADFDLGKHSTSLLYGVTGSGKTSVYISFIKNVIKHGKSAIVLLPEISLTHQSLKLFYENFGSDVAVIHSGLSIGQRMDEWKRIKLGGVSVVVGTRSAIFAPLENIGAIIIDEEQEHTYKSESTPKYNAKELAKFRCSYHACQLILASATPSIEAFSRAKTGQYKLLQLSRRYNDGDLPEVSLVDMRLELASGNHTTFSEYLKSQIEQRITKGEQSILLINRRGYNTHASCIDCGEPIFCQNCSISMTYHSDNGRLMCHYCGSTKAVESHCEHCGGEKIKLVGSGTQKIEQELSMTFPGARVLRIDADAVHNKLLLEEYIDDFTNKKYDIMVGTQMIAKGFNFPCVTLVGVLNADQSLYAEDYRSLERTFALLTQVVGRAGRHELKGEAIIQTFSPEAKTIMQAKTQNYEEFFESELRVRRLMTYPPYCDICQITFLSDFESNAMVTAKEFYGIIKKLIMQHGSEIKAIVYAPTPANIIRVKNKYRYKLLLKCKNSAFFRSMLMVAYKSIPATTFKNVNISIDINPEEIL